MHTASPYYRAERKKNTVNIRQVWGEERKGDFTLKAATQPGSQTSAKLVFSVLHSFEEYGFTSTEKCCNK